MLHPYQFAIDENTVNAFYLGVCEENSVKDLLDKKDWNKEFIDGDINGKNKGL